jgi:hypothetical protein
MKFALVGMCVLRDGYAVSMSALLPSGAENRDNERFPEGRRWNEKFMR